MNNIEKIIGGVTFTKYEEFWMADILFDQSENTFEIHSEELNLMLVESVISELNKAIPGIHNRGIKLLKVLSELFWEHNRNDIFSFSGFVIDEYTENNLVDFRMCYHCSGQDGFTDFANWYLDIKDFKITGSHRSQL